jgi:hypothetical protein
MQLRDLHPNIKIRFLQTFVNEILGNMVHPFMTIYFADRFGLTWAGILLSANVVIGMIAGFYGGPLADRIGRKKVLLYAEYLRFLAFAVMALANSPWFYSPYITFAMTALISVYDGVLHDFRHQSAMVVDRHDGGCHCGGDYVGADQPDSAGTRRARGKPQYVSRRSGAYPPPFLDDGIDCRDPGRVFVVMGDGRLVPADRSVVFAVVSARI